MSTPEEDLVLVWESGRRVDHNYAVGAGGAGLAGSQMWKVLGPVHPERGLGGISSLCSPGLLPPQPTV